MAFRLLLVGCGKMGGALLAGWLDRGLAAADIRVVEPAEAAAAALAGTGVGVHPALEAVPAPFVPDVVVLAVKPQMMADVLPACRLWVAPETVFLSIAAGKTLGFFEGLLGDGAAVVRAMPNTPAAVRRGMTALCANGRVSEAQRAACQELLEAVGAVAWLDDEALMDAVTAISGSGPAYVFLLAESLAQAGAAAGLPADLAARLARETVAGAGELLYRAPETPATLRRNVTSPGGTTAAALEVLMGAEGWQAILDRAVAAATRRSRALAG